MCKSEIILATNFCWNASFFLSFFQFVTQNEFFKKLQHPEKVSVFVYFSTTVNHNLFFSLPRLEKNLLKNFFSFSQFSIKCQTLWQFQYSNLHYAMHFNLCVCVKQSEKGGGIRLALSGCARGCGPVLPASQPIN